MDPRAGRNRSGMIRTPRVCAPTLTATRAAVPISVSAVEKLRSTNTICPRVLAHQRRLAGPCREGNHG